MRKLVFSAAASIILLGAGLALAKDSTFSGEIFDSQCAKMGSHEEMLKKEGMGDKKDDPMARKMCTVNCVKMGGKYVLLDRAKKTVYQLDDQQKPDGIWSISCGHCLRRRVRADLAESPAGEMPGKEPALHIARQPMALCVH